MDDTRVLAARTDYTSVILQELYIGHMAAMSSKNMAQTLEIQPKTKIPFQIRISRGR